MHDAILGLAAAENWAAWLRFEAGNLDRPLEIRSSRTFGTALFPSSLSYWPKHEWMSKLTLHQLSTSHYHSWWRGFLEIVTASLPWQHHYLLVQPIEKVPHGNVACLAVPQKNCFSATVRWAPGPHSDIDMVLSSRPWLICKKGWYILYTSSYWVRYKQELARLSLLITTSVAVLLGDCDSGGFVLVLLLCTAIWPIEEMPHGDMLGFCLAAPRDYVSLGRSRWAPLGPRRWWYMWCTLIQADLRREGPISACVVVADYDLYDNCIADPAEWIRNAAGRHGQLQASESYDSRKEFYPGPLHTGRMDLTLHEDPEPISYYQYNGMHHVCPRGFLAICLGSSADNEELHQLELPFHPQS